MSSLWSYLQRVLSALPDPTEVAQPAPPQPEPEPPQLEPEPEPEVKPEPPQPEPPQPETKPAPTIVTYNNLSGAFVPAWLKPVIAKPHLKTMSTPHGPGWDFICDAKDVTIWDKKMKAILAQWRHARSPINTTEQWDFRLNLPKQTFASKTFWNAGVLFEFHTDTSSGHNLSIDNTGRGVGGANPSFRMGVQTALGNTFKYTWTDKIIFDHWYHVIMLIRWTTAKDGFARIWIDGKQWVNHSGPTCFANDGNPYLQFGYYADLAEGETNYSQFGAITRTDIPQ